jgi:hypothetical protein
VSLIINNEDHLLRALADTGVSTIIIIFEAYTSDPFIKGDDSNTTTWINNGCLILLQIKLEYFCDIFTTRVQSQETNVFFWGISSG